MPTIHQVRCPNCGRLAQRVRSQSRQRQELCCEECDYLLVTCLLTGRVLEAYAPGLRGEASRSA